TRGAFRWRARRSGPLQDQALERNRPAVPVRAFRLGRDRHDEVLAKRFPITVEARLDDRGAQAEHARLPRRLEDEFAVPARRSGGTVYVEQLGVHSRATPIIESRVTTSARASSDRPPVPAAPSGTTRQRPSAEESQTRNSTSPP